MFCSFRLHNISTHAPRVGSDWIVVHSVRMLVKFQPTLPAWGATRHQKRQANITTISTHAPRVGSDDGWYKVQYAGKISTHAPRVGSDSNCESQRVRSDVISTHAPRVGSDLKQYVVGAYGNISTHAPRVGSDAWARTSSFSPINFNPRSPRGERPSRYSSLDGHIAFQPTLPAWGATLTLRIAQEDLMIFQPTLPAWGATKNDTTGYIAALFQPTLPAWGATLSLLAFLPLMIFQPTLPAWGATQAFSPLPDLHRISTHAPRVGSDFTDKLQPAAFKDFNPRSPRGERPVPVVVTSLSMLISTHAPRVGSDRS